MLSTQTRLRIEDIAARIAGGLDVSLAEMQWVQKWADHNHSAAEILKKARRRAMNGGDPPAGGVDELLDGLNIGNPDPTDHLIGPQTADELARWFHREKPDDWRQRD